MRSVLAVFLGGTVGTLLRFSMTGQANPTVTWLINIVGAFVLGLLISRLWPRPQTPVWLKAGLGTGLLGGFTTYSAVTLEMGYWLSGTVRDTVAHPSIAFLQVILMIGALAFFVVYAVSVVLAAWAGLAIGRRGRSGQAATLERAHPITDEGVDL